ncbi:uncharacterized protein LTR77_002505 [Saxophila tyrrhenica]|uniref:Uncharacterized protein n=1 Tax=Saxophila tyrrhenica TaxID=1690608 RepID=A0AAV9PJF0_9PEZI|nr:hypothetical protein LTR77_002505 [Saxophila tyrrhenica]
MHLRHHSTEEDEKQDSKSLSSNSSTDTLPPPYSGQTNSASPTDLTSPVPELLPSPGKILTIQARGMKNVFCSPSELILPIFSGTDITVEPLYTSTRPSKRKNNAVLSHSQRGDIISTTYRFGPGREPKVRYLQSQSQQQTFANDVKRAESSDSDDDAEGPLALEVDSGHLFKHTVTLTSTPEASRRFKWKYTRTPTEPEGKKKRVLALYAEGGPESSSSSRSGDDWEAIAVLVRTESTRTEGTSKWGWGNGGQLFFSHNAAEHMEEGLLVATCIMMMKKEVDRGRGTQGAMIAGAMGGGFGAI